MGLAQQPGARGYYPHPHPEGGKSRPREVKAAAGGHTAEKLWRLHWDPVYTLNCHSLQLQAT